MSNELLSIDQQIAELKARKQAIIDSQRAEVLQSVRASIAQFGFTASELGLRKGNKPAKSSKPVTFRDPQSGQTWDGQLNQKGRKPEWIKAKIADGSIEKYRVGN